MVVPPFIMFLTTSDASPQGKIEMRKRKRRKKKRRRRKRKKRRRKLLDLTEARLEMEKT